MKRLMAAAVVLAVAAGCNKAAPTPEGGASSPAAPQAAQNGLGVQVLQAGAGKEAHKGDKVKVHYVGTFTDGRKFESSRDRGEPFGFRLGAGMVIPGWDQGIDGMKVGEVRKLTIPPSLGYGGSQVGPIPPNSTLVFEVELVDVL